MREPDELQRQIEQRIVRLDEANHQAHKLPKHGFRRQCVDKLILSLTSEIKVLMWVNDEKKKHQFVSDALEDQLESLFSGKASDAS